jgi:hypothetical protein
MEESGFYYFEWTALIKSTAFIHVVYYLINSIVIVLDVEREMDLHLSCGGINSSSHITELLSRFNINTLAARLLLTAAKVT